jgi:hypothetical protein
MKKHSTEGRDSRVQTTTVHTLTAMPDAYQFSIDHAGSGPKKGSTSLLLGGMTKARVPELNGLFTHSPSFGPEPVVGFGGSQGTNARLQSDTAVTGDKEIF